ncbi:SUMF1/EgtB/PvdO family nonheme iron enzyme [bacterium]|nr:SUMF1/EgtB/PvdO family nonheme iron enzyme [bacterium]
MNRTNIFKIIPAIIFLLSNALFAQQLTTLAVLDFEGLGITESEAKALTNRLRSVLVNTGAYQVVERGKMDAILDEQGFQLSGCTSEECVVEVGQLLGVQKMLAGSISLVGKTYSVEMRIIDIELGKIERSATYDIKEEIDQLLTFGMKNALNILLDDKKARKEQRENNIISAKTSSKHSDNTIIPKENTTTATPKPGTLKIFVEPQGATILINKKDYSGKFPIELMPGQYNLEVRKEGYVTKKDVIKIQSGQAYSKTYRLLQKTSRLQFNVQPNTANIELKQSGIIIDKWVGTNSLRLPIGEYKLTCDARGYKSQWFDIVISDDQILKKEVILEMLLKTEESIYGNIDNNMILIQGGTFTMGSNTGDSDEKPVHQETLSSFYFCRYEVTQLEWQSLMGGNPSHFRGDFLPVEYVSWDNAVNFCNKLSERQGLTPCYTINETNIKCNYAVNGYRLPSEAEWEYVALGGNQSQNIKYSSIVRIDSIAWYYDNSGKKTRPVGTKKSNDLGIYDMSGNVEEWCNNLYNTSYEQVTYLNNSKGSPGGVFRVFRGGSWFDSAFNCRPTNRNYNIQSEQSKFIGFRLCRSAN